MGESYIQSQLELLKLLPSSTNGEIFTGEKTAREIIDSLVSWIGTRFTQFFLFINQSKLTGNLTDDCFRFVPAPTVLNEQGNRIPGKFDHIYTDQELYKTFNIPQKYIDVIEAIIKERKQ